ncbi:MAG: uroporphyrinogen-III C-methyltransferase, partial [Azoarcus sp.]|nr:uroporphyrinogen-III C-methyltransferase [Azoarcus sp.]
METSAPRAGNSGEPRPGLQPGKVWLVGAGPGDPELLTLKAARLISRADAIVYDHLVGTGILSLARPDAEIIYAGKEASRHTLPQAQINPILAALARRRLAVVRLKGGDPFIFGR